MEERDQQQPQDEVKLPEERVEDLEPEAEEAQDAKGGAPGNFKYTNITLKRGT